MNETADCEGRDDWFWQQDVNAWTSLAFLIPAAVALRWAVRRRLGAAFVVFATLAAAEAAGSVLFHGTGGDVAQALHDLPLIGLLMFVAGWHVGRLTRWPATHIALAATVGGLVVGTALWVVAVGVVNVLVGVALAPVVVAETIAVRRGRPAVWTPALLVLVALGLTTWALGRAGSPLCDPASLAQWHGLWHVLSALVLAAWVARVGAITAGDTDLRIARPFIDRTLGLVATGLVLAFHRSVDVVGRPPTSGRQPTLIVANHANGFVDPLLLTAALGRLPRLVAKATLWKVLPARPVLALAGVLPVHRSGDGERSDNTGMFAASDRELARRGTVAIFPEGTTGDRGGLDRVRKGAARIALGAVADAPGLRILPVGMAYESRIETRSRALVMFGDELDVQTWVAQHPNGDPVALAADLTDEIRDRLAAVAPDYASRDDREWMRAAARVSLSDGSHHVGFGAIEQQGRRLAALPDTTRARLWTAYADYAARLSLIGVTDDDLVRPRPPLRQLVVTALAVAVAAPLITFGVVIHLPALLLVTGATGAVHATATKGTVRMIVGALAGLLTWFMAGLLLGDGWGVIGYALVAALTGALALAVITPWLRAARGVWATFRLRDRGSLVDGVVDHRQRFITLVEETLT